MQPDQMMGGVEVVMKPMVFQRGSAACIHAAAEQGFVFRFFRIEAGTDV